MLQITNFVKKKKIMNFTRFEKYGTAPIYDLDVLLYTEADDIFDDLGRGRKERIWICF